MDFVAVLDQVLALLRQRGRMTYRTLQRQFQLDDDALHDLTEELLYAHPEVRDDAGRGLVWTGDAGTAPAAPAAPVEPPGQVPLAYTPPYLAEKILTSRSALEGERKQVTVLFADLKGSMELLADRDPEDARQLLDPVLERMMTAVHRYEGTVNQVMGDGIMALFGAPLAHEDHAVRACYAALTMQDALRRYSTEVRRTHGVEVQIRVGLNSGEVVVRAIGNDLHMDYSAIGETTHLAARMEQLAPPGTIRLTAGTLRLVEGFMRVTALGPVPVKGLAAPVEVFDLVGASALRQRLQVAAVRGLTPFVGRQTELDVVQRALAVAGTGQGQVVALVGDAGVGKSRLVYEVLHSHRTVGWRVLESASVSYGKATPYFPLIELLKRYAHVEEQDDTRTIRAKVTGQVVTLDAGLQDVLLHMRIPLQQLDQGEVGCGFPVRHRGALQHPPAHGTMGVQDLIDQAGFADASVAWWGTLASANPAWSMRSCTPIVPWWRSAETPRCRTGKPHPQSDRAAEAVCACGGARPAAPRRVSPPARSPWPGWFGYRPAPPDMRIPLQQLDQGEVGCGFPVRHRGVSGTRQPTVRWECRTL